LSDTTRQIFTRTRVDHWNYLAETSLARPSMSSGYHSRLRQVYRFLIPQGKRVLEIGCGKGDLLADLAPCQGVGIDFSSVMLRNARQKHLQYHFVEADVHDLGKISLDLLGGPFDAIILSDLINDLWDVHEALRAIHPLCSPETRLILNFHNSLWEKPANCLQKMGAMTPRLEQNWLRFSDVENIIRLAGFEVIQSFNDFLWPWNTKLFEPLCNRYLAKFPPFRFFNISHFMICRIEPVQQRDCMVSVVIPARNEAGNIEEAIQRTPEMGSGTEIIFVEGNSTDNTWATINQVMLKYPDRRIRAFKQAGNGKGDAVRLGFDQAQGDILMILDADLTVPPESLPQFYAALISGKAEFVNGVRLVYPQEKEAMRFLNFLGNKFFSWAFSRLLNRNIKDTLCGTKVLSRHHYEQLAEHRSYFGEFDPFGDFDLLFGAAKMNLRIIDLPVRYRERTYGETNIQRWRHGALLFRMVLFAAHRLKFI
jgi:ubiquinone/menaquinone biosynthesis C-methylase UbiE